jgi:hypothetical protein
MIAARREGLSQYLGLKTMSHYFVNLLSPHATSTANKTVWNQATMAPIKTQVEVQRGVKRLGMTRHGRVATTEYRGSWDLRSPHQLLVIATSFSHRDVEDKMIAQRP